MRASPLFLKGISSALYNVPFCYALFLGSYEIGRLMQGIDFRQQMTMTQGAIAGAWAGFACCAIMKPMELIKCKLQMEVLPQGVPKTKAMEMTRQIWRSEGIKELYRGNIITLIREVPACSLCFASYECVKKAMNDRYGPNNANLLVAGDIAGFASSVVSCPQDCVKTKIRLDLGPNKQYKSHPLIRDGGIISCTKEIWINEGMRCFWKGFSA